MSAQKKMTKSDRKKRGGIYLALAVVSVLVYAMSPGALIETIASGFMLIFFIGGLYYLITGFTKKEAASATPTVEPQSDRCKECARGTSPLCRMPSSEEEHERAIHIALLFQQGLSRDQAVDNLIGRDWNSQGARNCVALIYSGLEMVSN